MIKPDKRTKFGTTPTTNKTTHFGKEPEIEGFPMAWRFSTADRNGTFAWDIQRLIESGDLENILNTLRDMEGLSLSQFRQQGSHPVVTHKLEKCARDRLMEIELDDLDSLFSFRITGRGRIWCIQDRHIMRILWWDPEHQVCPSLKKHT